MEKEDTYTIQFEKSGEYMLTFQGEIGGWRHYILELYRENSVTGLSTLTFTLALQLIDEQDKSLPEFRRFIQYEKNDVAVLSLVDKADSWSTFELVLYKENTLLGERQRLTVTLDL